MGIIRRYREALEEAEGQEDMFVEVGIFKGTRENSDKWGVATDLISHFQDRLPGIKIETFVVPVPEDENAAAVVRSNIISNVNKIFDEHVPRRKELN